MNDIQPGDLVVCVDAAPTPGCSAINAIRNGAVYRVSACRWDGDVHRDQVRLQGVLADTFTGWFRATRFRKLNDGTEDQELIAKIRACKPARTLVEARYPGWQHADQCARYLAQAMSIADREAARRGETSDLRKAA